MMAYTFTKSNNPLISDIKSPEYLEFTNHLTEFASELAQLIVRDGEGATKFIEIRVKVIKYQKKK